MEILKIEAEKREEFGKRPMKRLRKNGWVPGVAYGPDQKPFPIKIRFNTIEKIFHHITETTPIDLVIDGKSYKVFLKMVQRDKITDKVVHIDFYVPTKGHKMRLNIPLRYEGKPIGVERGGTLEILVEELPVEIDPDKLIEEIEVDISNVGLGESLHVKDLELPEDVKPLLDEEEVLLVVVAPRGLSTEEEEKEEEAAAEEKEEEPEVIKKGKKEEEE